MSRSGHVQTLFLREHNRMAWQLGRAFPDWTDEQLYQAARKWNIALLQVPCIARACPQLRLTNVVACCTGTADHVRGVHPALGRRDAVVRGVQLQREPRRRIHVLGCRFQVRQPHTNCSLPRPRFTVSVWTATIVAGTAIRRLSKSSLGRWRPAQRCPIPCSCGSCTSSPQRWPAARILTKYCWASCPLHKRPSIRYAGADYCLHVCCGGCCNTRAGGGGRWT